MTFTELDEELEDKNKLASSKKIASIAIKVGVSLFFFFVWHGTQIFLNSIKMEMPNAHFDRVMYWFSPVNEFFNHHKLIPSAVLILTSAHVDIAIVGLIIWGVFGTTIRPVISIFFLLVFRQVCQFLINEPVPPGMVWYYPGFPSLIVTYHTTFDFYFSGHTGAATLVALDIGKRNYKHKIYLVAAVILVGMEAFFIISMQFHYTADVITGFFAAVTAFFLAEKISPKLDQFIGKLDKWFFSLKK